MGVIKDGKVSGIIPGNEAFAVHYPGYPSSMSRAIQTLGGTQAILKARSSQSNKLELFFRPEDPYSHPTFGELRACSNLLLKISKKKSSSSINSPNSANKSEAESCVETEVCADIVARIPEAYHFDGMVDYQHVVAVHADAARRKKRNWTEMEEPHFEKAGLMDFDQEDVMILLPPLFTTKDFPVNLVLKPPAIASSKKKQEEAVESHVEMNLEPALAIDFNIKEIPKEINWKANIIQGTDLWGWQMAVSDLFEERPIWPKDALTDRLLDKNLKFTHQTLRRLLLAVAYYFSGGPFLRFWIKKGYDPRKDPESRIYQRIDFRVPPSLRSNSDANAANSLKQKWEDLCKFQVFPYKFQTSLQLSELDDDYIQQEIRKPPKQTTCTYGTGWFTQHVHDSFRHRVMVRFLSVYPKPGAAKLLKATSEDFEKSKRACIFKDGLKPDQQQQRISKEVIVDEANENQNNVDESEMDDIEVDDPEEELDAYEELDLAGEDDETSFQSHSFLYYLGIDLEDNSRSYLQELFDSFQPVDGSGDQLQDADTSDGEYQIYEQDDDCGNPDDDDD
ncbi:general transcription factor 3C polypeptide 5 isoform X4 [Manihot esculenta]|uniref:general transcription factor 3C polypeptide 5 isoform X4 n=1 Tax=Manihot esculenta TaxID=3983 RepID=UPI000B5D90A7|nr:general transcription factor 3C polypeptide 5 isoform X4 [Manihot esculenta]